jgi:hypothetical protein
MTQNPNPEPNIDFDSRIDAEETLRLLAQLPPPDSLTDRVHARVRHQIALQNSAPVRRGFWSLWSPGQRMQFAGAAVLVIAVASSVWTINRAHQTGYPSGTGPSTPQLVVPSQSDSGFSGAKAERVPATLNPIKVPPAPKKKPSPKGAAKPATRTSQPTGPITRAVAAQPEPDANR